MPMRRWLPLLLLAALPAAALREIDLRVRSEAAGPDGIAVRVAVPEAPRYGAGAPVVIHVPGGWGAGDLSRVLSPLAPLGFVELRFLFPGPAAGAVQTGGRDDRRGPQSILALADVIAFAAGGRDSRGRTLAQLVAPLVPAPGNVGVVGWSTGGNAAVLTLVQQRRKVQGLAWLATWETPVGDGAATLLWGAEGERVNPAVDPRTGVVDYSSLAYSETLPVALVGGGLGPPGAFYFDFDRNGQPDGRDLPPLALPAPALGDATRFVYPLSLVTAAEQGRLLARWPGHLLDRRATERFWQERDPSGQLIQARINLERLLVMVLGGTPDHLQPVPEAHHLYNLYQGWLEAKLPWVRFNPDQAYLAALAGEAAGELPEVFAGVPLGRQGLTGQRLPTDRVPPPLLVAAAACELADRVAAGDRSPDLEAILFPTVLRRGWP